MNLTGRQSLGHRSDRFSAKQSQKHFQRTQGTTKQFARRTRRIAPPLSTLAILGTSLSPIASTAGTVWLFPVAHMARTMRATDEAHLRYIRSKSSESRLFEEGAVSGTIPGSLHAECYIGATFTASVTIYTHDGTIKARGTASPHNSSLYTSFAGTLTITGGTGRYTHAHGHAGLYGIFDRRTYALTVQTTGQLSY